MKFNLQKRTKKACDYSWHRSKGLGATTLPLELSFVSPILSQDDEDCTAFASVATRWNETSQVNFDPSIFYNDELEFSGEPSSYEGGFDLGVPAAVGVKFGFTALGNPTSGNAPSAYFWITANSGMDLFDSCRSAIVQSNYPLMAGLNWMDEYTSAPQGIINQFGSNLLGGHCVKLAGWKQINNETYIIIQNSWGAGVGDNGCYYMPRSVFNGAFSPYGVFLWSDSTNIEVKTLGMLQALYQNIKTLLKLN